MGGHLPLSVPPDIHSKALHREEKLGHYVPLQEQASGHAEARFVWPVLPSSVAHKRARTLPLNILHLYPFFSPWEACENWYEDLQSPGKDGFPINANCWQLKG